jgi:hypothetical protein
MTTRRQEGTKQIFSAEIRVICVQKNTVEGRKYTRTGQRPVKAFISQKKSSKKILK